MGKSMKVTIKDVARKANCSVATISRVMNGNYPVKEETRQKVLKAIEALNYIPNMQAKELTKRTSNTIGIVSPSIDNMFFSEVIDGIQKEFKSSYYSIILTCSNNDSEEELSCINNLISRNVAGIIVIDPSTKNIKSKLYDNISNNIPLVFINGFYPTENISSVSNNEAEGASIALNYLIEKNHKDILFIRGKNSFSYDVKEAVYVKKMKELQAFSEENIINIGDGNSKDTVDITAESLTPILESTKATAIFCCNDLMAVGVLNACKKLKIKVPNQLSIIGFDNIDLSRYVEPKITTIDQNMFILGSKAANLLAEKIQSNNKFNKRITLNNKLVERNTVNFIQIK